MRREATHPTSPEDGVLVEEGNAFLFSLDQSFQTDLDSEALSVNLRQQFLDNEIILSNNATVAIVEPGSKWQISDNGRKYIVRKSKDLLDTYGEGLTAAVDQNLKGETVYYYTLFPYRGDPRKYVFDRHNRTSAIATGPYNLAGQMYELLPALYHRYDTIVPKSMLEEMLEEDGQKGQLRRFLDLPGGQLDQLYSFTKAMLNLYDLDRLDGRLLPLLAEWIGWDTDFTLEIAAQRNEIRNALDLYKTIGIIPTVEATVKRISGWEARTKEFVHNVFLTNRPERLNLWERQRNGSGEWSEPTAPLSLNFAYEGRPTAVRDAEEILWLFYHTLKKDQWDIWYKTHSNDSGWTPSRPLTNSKRVDKHPTAVIQGETLWVFWGSYDVTANKWRLDYRIHVEGEWSAIQTLFDNEIERKQPWAVVDDMNGLWLFWLERVDATWQMKYNRHEGVDWKLALAVIFPLDGANGPRVESAPFVLFHPSDSDHRLWIFWARMEVTGEPDKTRWQIAYRVKQGIDPNVFDDWSVIKELLKVTPDSDYND
ncbi:MAG: phage tail protein, partial [Verrucomicrobia bacterium]|nr:phage tail protein [Verrucomicrobiota bacterium]